MVKMVQLYRIQKYTSLAHPMGNVFVVLVAFSIAGVSQILRPTWHILRTAPT